VSEPHRIPGWFTFQPVYEWIAETAPPGGLLVEVGVFCGRSLAFLADKRGHDCRVVGVDTFTGSPEFGTMVKAADGTAFPDWPTGTLARMAIEHLSRAGLYPERVQLVASDSVRAAGLFADESVWMVMLDGAHDYESVKADIAAWWPKVAPGGVLCGDDHDEGFPGVMQAVAEAFPAANVSGSAWAVRKVLAPVPATRP